MQPVKEIMMMALLTTSVNATPIDCLFDLLSFWELNFLFSCTGLAPDLSTNDNNQYEDTSPKNYWDYWDDVTLNVHSHTPI
jgi:hypothetical protein